jgi:hypothetical protein
MSSFMRRAAAESLPLFDGCPPVVACRTKMPAYVRFGSEADICGAKRHVRFTPESGHVQCTSLCLLWAKSGHLLLS